MASKLNIPEYESKLICIRCEKERDCLHFLPCLHTLCYPCIKNRSNVEQSCPKCAQPIPQGQVFPAKFCGEFECDSCSKSKDSEDFWFCGDCVCLVCSHCCIRKHQRHNILEWGGSSEAVQQMHRQLQDLCHDARDDLGNWAKLLELMRPVLRALRGLLKENAASLQRLSSWLQEVYKLPHLEQTPESVSDMDDLDVQSVISASGETPERDDVELLLKVVEKVLKHAQAPDDPSLTRRLQGFTSSPETVAQLIFDQLNFGEEDLPLFAGTPIVEELANLSIKENPKVDTNQKKACVNVTERHSTLPFTLKTKTTPSMVIFGSRWAVVVLWEAAVQVWNFRDGRKKKSNTPAKHFHFDDPSEGVHFKAAAVCDLEKTNDPGANRLYILVQKDSTWSLLLLNLSSGEPIGKKMHLEWSNIESGCLGVTSNNATAFVSLAFSDKSSKLWKLGTDMQLTKLPDPPACFKNIQPLNPEKKIFILACLEKFQPKIHLCLVDSGQIQWVSTFLVKSQPSNIQFFWHSEKVLLIRQGKQLHTWKLLPETWKTESWASTSIETEPETTLGCLNGSLIGGTPRDGCIQFCHVHTITLA